MVNVFDDLIGHAAVKALLEAEAAHPAQAYLFVGPGGVGKAAAARRFAAMVLCPDGADDRCRRRVLAGSHADLVVVEPDGRTAITVDQARRAVSQASLAPLEGGRKIFLFEDGGAINDEAANALLKTLEEPSASTVFIITVESLDTLPKTIASRCRTVVFGRVDDSEIAEGLVALGVESDQAQRAARIAGGRPGLAVALATEPEVAEFREVWLGVPMRLSEHPGDAFTLAEEVIGATEPLLAAIRERHAREATAAESHGGGGKVLKDRHDRELRRASAALYVSGLEILSGFYRDTAAAQFGVPVRNPDIAPSALTRLRPAAAIAGAERIVDAIESLHANQRPQLALAALFSDLGSAN